MIRKWDIIKEKATWKISARPFQQGGLKAEENRMENVCFHRVMDPEFLFRKNFRSAF